MAVLNLVDALLGGADRLARWLAGAALLLMTFLLFGSSLSRFLFNWALVGSDELARVLAIWTTFLGAAAVVRVNQHVAIDILLRMASSNGFRLLNIAIGLISAATMAYVTWHGGQLAWKIYLSGQVSPVLPMLKVVFYLPVPIGGGLMCAGFLMLATKAALGILERPDDLDLAASAPDGEQGEADIPEPVATK